MISTKNVDIPGTRGVKVEGEDMKSIVIIFPTGQPSIKEAVDRALEKGDGDVLLDGVIYMKQWYIPYIYGEMGYVVDGTAMRTSPPGTAPQKRARAVVAPPAAPVSAGPIGGAAAAEAPVEPPQAAPDAAAPAKPAAGQPGISAAKAAAELLP